MVGTHFGKTKANFWVMMVAGIFVIAIVPFIAGRNPVFAVWIYTGGWAVSALSMIGFFYLEGFPLDWWKAYGEPLVPALCMGIFMEVGRFTGAYIPWFIFFGILCLLVLTLYIETQSLHVRRIRLFQPKQ
jgi:hypothetical protein